MMLFAASVAVTSCSDSEGDGTTPEVAVETTVTFESGLVDCEGDAVELETIDLTSMYSSEFSNVFTGYYFSEYVTVTGYYTGTEYQSLLFDGLLFYAEAISTKVYVGSYFSDGMVYESAYATFGGFVLSKNSDDVASKSYTDTSSYEDQFVVLSSSDDNTFLAGYDSSWSGGYGCPTIELSTARKIKSVEVANNTISAAYAASVTASVNLKIAGLVDGSEVESESVELVSASGTVTLSDWTTVTLEWETAVDELQFTIVSDDSYAPYFFCVDNLVIYE